MKPCIDHRPWMLTAALLLSACAAAPERAAVDSEVTAPSRELRSEYEQALALMREQQYEEARAALAALTTRHPGLAGPWLNLGIADMELGRTDEAKAALLAAAERNPGNAEAYNLLGVLHRETGHFGEARDAYRRALEVDPGYAAAHRNLGILFDLYLQQPEAALAQYQRYLDTDPSDLAEVELWVIDLKRRTGRTQAQLGSRNP